MGAIAFSEQPEHIWVVAGWAFRQLLDDVSAKYPNDSEMRNAFDEAKAIGGLIVYRLQPDVAVRITEGIRAVASAILADTAQSGLINQTYGNKQAIEQYQIGLRQLLDATQVSAEEHGAEPGPQKAR